MMTQESGKQQSLVQYVQVPVNAIAQSNEYKVG